VNAPKDEDRVEQIKHTNLKEVKRLPEMKQIFCFTTPAASKMGPIATRTTTVPKLNVIQ
jgi:hypothetical protein